MTNTSLALYWTVIATQRKNVILQTHVNLWCENKKETN